MDTGGDVPGRSDRQHRGTRLIGSEIGEEDNKAVSDTEYYERFRDKGPDLEHLIHVPSLLAHLLKHGVVDRYSKQTIQAPAEPYLQVRKLLEHVQRSDIRSLECFLHPLHDAGQIPVIRLLGFDPSVYTSTPVPGTSSTPWTQTPSDEVDEWIKDHNEWLAEEIMQIPVLDIFNEKIMDLSANFIEVEMLMNPRRGPSSKREVIANRNIFTPHKAKQAPRTVLLSGVAGSGKTSFIRGFIKTTCSEPESTGKSLMVFLQAKDIQKGTTEEIWQAVKENIYGEHCEELYEAVHYDKHIRLFLFIDGVDELRDEKVIRGIKDFIQNSRRKGKPIIFVSTRENKAGVEKKKFDRELETRGFTIKQGLLYVSRYVEISQEEEEEKEFEETELTKLFDYLSLESQESELIRAILRNPLRLLIVCYLVHEKCVHFNTVGKLRISDLYNEMDNLLVKRETKSKPGGVLWDATKIKYFHRMFLYSVFNGKSKITDKGFRKFLLDAQFPLVKLLVRSKQVPNSKDEEWIYEPYHETFMDYWTARGVLSLPMNIRKLLLFYFSSDSVWETIQLLLCDALSDDKPMDRESKASILTDFLQWMIIMHPSEDKIPDDDLFRHLRLKCKMLLQKIDTEFKCKNDRGEEEYDRLFTLLMSEKISNGNLLLELDKLCTEIAQGFDGQGDDVAKRAWWVGTMDEVDEDGFHFPGSLSGHVGHCLDYLHDGLDVEVRSRTIDRLLPCHYDLPGNNESLTYYKVRGTGRCCQVTRVDTNTYFIDSWSPADSSDVINQWQSGPHKPHAEDLDITLNYCFRKLTYGTPPLEAFSESEYSGLMNSLPSCASLSFTLAAVEDIPIMKNSSDECQNALPIFQAMISKSFHKTLKSLSITNGYIKISELLNCLSDFKKAHQEDYRIDLEDITLLEDEAMGKPINRKSIWEDIAQWVILKKPKWFGMDGENVSDLYQAEFEKVEKYIPKGNSGRDVTIEQTDMFSYWLYAWCPQDMADGVEQWLSGPMKPGKKLAGKLCLRLSFEVYIATYGMPPPEAFTSNLYKELFTSLPVSRVMNILLGAVDLPIKHELDNSGPVAIPPKTDSEELDQAGASMMKGSTFQHQHQNALHVLKGLLEAQHSLADKKIKYLIISNGYINMSDLLEFLAIFKETHDEKIKVELFGVSIIVDLSSKVSDVRNAMENTATHFILENTIWFTPEGEDVTATFIDKRSGEGEEYEGDESELFSDSESESDVEDNDDDEGDIDSNESDVDNDVEMDAERNQGDVASSPSSKRLKTM